MIVRPHICLRCQLRLAKRTTVSRSQIAYQSSNAQPVSEKEYVIRSSPSQVDGALPPIRQPVVAIHRGIRSEVSHRPFYGKRGKLYGFLGTLQQEQRESLDVKALGKHAEVIVLRDSKVTTSIKALREIDAIEPRSIDILATLNGERGLVGQKEVEENVNQFRPKEGQHPHTWDEINELVQDLHRGFTSSQLGRYIQSFGTPMTPPAPLPGPGAHKKFIRISPWVPLSGDDSDVVQHWRRSNGAHPFASYTGKQLLALRLIQECWHVDVSEIPNLEGEEESEVIGEIEIKLSAGVYKLLVNGYKPILRRIQSELLTLDGEGYQYSDTNNSLRIRTTEAKSKLVIEELEEELEQLRKVRIDLLYLAAPYSPGRPRTKAQTQELQTWINYNFNDSKLEQLGDITKTSILKVSQNKVLISCMDPDKDGLVSNRADVALRLMIMSTDLPKSRTTHWLGRKEGGKKSFGAFIPFPASRAFPWYARSRDWMRWATPIKKWVETTTPEAIEAAEPRSENLTNGPPESSEALVGGENLEISEIISPLPSKPDLESELDIDNGPLHWTADYYTESSALLGSILHALPQKSENTKDKLLPADLSSKAERFFSAGVPHVSVLLGSQHTKMTRRTPIKSVIMRLVPNPNPHQRMKKPAGSGNTGAAVFKAFPNIEMHFKIMPDTNDLVLDNIQAIVSTDISDLMMPDSTVDVRFEQNVRSRLRGKQGEDSYPASIIEFLDRSDLNLDRTLVTPPKVTIPIASHLCRDPAVAQHDSEKEAGQMRDVEYLFAGLEICKTMVMDFDGWTLNYTSVESGSAQGRRGELRLRPRRRVQTSKPYTEADFTNSVFQLVKALDEGNTGQVHKGLVKTPLVRWTGPNGAQDQVRKKFHYFSKKIDLRTLQEKREDAAINSFWRRLEDGEIESLDGDQPSFGNYVESWKG